MDVYKDSIAKAQADWERDIADRQDCLQEIKELIEKLKRKSLKKNLMTPEEIEAYDREITEKIKTPLDAEFALRDKEALDKQWTVTLESEIEDDLEHDMRLWYQKLQQWSDHYRGLKVAKQP